MNKKSGWEWEKYNKAKRYSGAELMKKGCEVWLSVLQCKQMYNANKVGVAFSYEYGVAIVDNSTCLNHVHKWQ